MIRSIVVGFDASPHAADALALGALLARPDRARITVVGVYVFRPIHREGDAEFESVVRAETRDRVAQATALVGDRPLELRVVRGESVADGLEQVAVECSADLIVVGSTHHGPLGRVMTRGMPETLVHDAPCAIAVPPRGYAGDHPRRLRTIGVGFDGEAESRHALDQAAGIARDSGARLEVIAALNPTFSHPAPPAVDVVHPSTLRQRLIRAAAEAAAAVDGVDATAVTVEGPAADALCERSTELDLLVLGSRGNGPLRRVLLGSVSTRVLHRARSPVLVVPRASAEPPEGSSPATASAAQ